MLDTLQREKQRQVSHPLEFRQLNRIYDNLIARLEARYPFIEFEHPDRQEFWGHVEIICGITNLRARDAIHLATAYGGLCDMVVTRDNRFVRVARDEVPIRFHVLTVLPKRLDEGLSQVGFTIDEQGQATRE
jgi:predicted nucleic acid-binding protein